MCTHLRIRGGGSRLHIIRSIPRKRARRRSPKMVLRMWVYTRGTFSWSSPLAFKEGGRRGLRGGGGRAVPNGWPRGGSPVCRMAARTYVRHLSTSKQQRRQLYLETKLLLIPTRSHCTAPIITICILKWISNWSRSAKKHNIRKTFQILLKLFCFCLLVYVSCKSFAHTGMYYNG